MFRIGLTGNIASGKSTVAQVWRRLGAHVVEADVLAREAVAPGSQGLDRVVEVFGPQVVGPEGELDRDRVREIVFADPDARRRLEAIVHPVVAELRAERERELAEQGARTVVHDIPLLFEVGMQDEFDLLVVVDAPASVREKRIVETRGLSPEQARRMIEAQMPAEAKRAEADIVIDNSGTLAELEASAEVAWRRIQERADGSA